MTIWIIASSSSEVRRCWVLDGLYFVEEADGDEEKRKEASGRGRAFSIAMAAARLLFAVSSGDGVDGRCCCSC